jgi:hypothetical protein
VKTIVTGFTDDIEEDKDGTGKAYGQACHIDEVK